jgi:hypothetical protein
MMAPSWGVDADRLLTLYCRAAHRRLLLYPARVLDREGVSQGGGWDRLDRLDILDILVILDTSLQVNNALSRRWEEVDYEFAP